MTEGSSAATTPAHVLVVDDDPAIRTLLSDYLGENELRVTAVAGGREMLAVLDQEVVDLVVLELDRGVARQPLPAG